MTKQTKETPSRDYVIGPNGEKRPKSTVANAMHVMKLATGMAEEEYVEDANKEKQKGPVSK